LKKFRPYRQAALLVVQRNCGRHCLLKLKAARQSCFEKAGGREKLTQARKQVDDVKYYAQNGEAELEAKRAEAQAQLTKPRRNMMRAKQSTTRGREI
jgi:hypothetical protein